MTNVDFQCNTIQKFLQCIKTVSTHMTLRKVFQNKVLNENATILDMFLNTSYFE